MNSDFPPAPRAWLTVALLWFVGGFNYLDRMMVPTMHGSLTEAIPMSEAQFGLLTSVFLWVYGLLSPLAGFLADRFSRSGMIIGSMFAWSAVTWLCAHATTFEEFLAARALMGVSEAAYLPAALALITEYHRGPTRSFATAVHVTGIMVGASLAGLAGGLAERHDWTFPFKIFGGAGIAYCGLLALALRDAPREPQEGAAAPSVQTRFGEAIISLFASRSFLLLVVYWGLFGIAGWMVGAWMPIYLKEHFRLAQGAAGLTATGYLQLSALVGVLFSGVWADRWSRRDPRARIFVSVIGLTGAVPGLLLVAGTDALAVAVAGLILYGFARSFVESNTMPVLCLVADPRYRATGFGVMNLFANLVGGCSIYVTGMLRDRHVDLDLIFQLGAFTLLLCALLLFLVTPRSRPPNGPTWSEAGGRRIFQS